MGIHGRVVGVIAGEDVGEGDASADGDRIEGEIGFAKTAAGGDDDGAVGVAGVQTGDVAFDGEGFQDGGGADEGGGGGAGVGEDGAIDGDAREAGAVGGDEPAVDVALDENGAEGFRLRRRRRHRPGRR